MQVAGDFPSSLIFSLCLPVYLSYLRRIAVYSSLPISAASGYLLIHHNLNVFRGAVTLMGVSQSISEAYEGWRDDSGNVSELREYIAARKHQIEEMSFEVSLMPH